MATEILDLDCAALEGHHEAGLELVLCATQLLFGNVRVQQQAQLVYEVGKDVSRGVRLAAARRDEGSKQAEEGRVGVNVVERRAVVDLREVVEDMGVQTGVHTLSGAA